MKKNVFSLILLTAFCCAALNFAQVSPENGVKPPSHFIEFHRMVQSEYSNGYFAEKFRKRRQIREQNGTELFPESGLANDTINALTLMGQYSDLQGFYSQQQFQSHLYDGPNPTGTVTDYYTEVSYDQLYFTGDAQGWYDMPGTLSEYEGGNSGLGTQGGPRFVWELLQISDPTLNFADYIQYYDTQGRPRIGFVAVVHSGADAAAGAYNIWSHRWTFTVFSGQSFTTNDIDPISGFNVIIDGDYAIMPELEGSNNSSGLIKAIGVFAHEYGHIFGLPDLYDTDGSSEGLGNWCLMAGGSYGGNGNSAGTPVHMSAWCKKQLGWVTPINITSFLEEHAVLNAEENPVIYRMWRDALITNQYFLVENRQKIGFDSYLYDSGFLIYHVDDSQGGNQNENRYKVDLEQADGSRNLNTGDNRGDGGDPFPGSHNNVKFDWDTHPNSKDYSLQNTLISVRNIYEDGNVMFGNFDVGLRSGPYIFGDPVTIDFGEVEIHTQSLIKKVVLANYGDQDLVITNIPPNIGEFTLETILTFPLTLASFDSLNLEFRFSPTATGNFSEVYPVFSNDPAFSGFMLNGSSYRCYPALDRKFYASSGSQNNGEILIIDEITGSGTLLGPSSFDAVKSITILPSTGIIYGLVSRATDCDIVKVNSGAGDSHILFTLDLSQMAGIAFDTTGNLYGMQRNGEVYKIDLNNGSYEFVVDAISTYSSIAINPLTNELWAPSASIVGSNIDAVFKVDLNTGDTTIVGHTGLGKRTNCLIFDDSGNLFGVIGSENEINEFISINPTNGIGTIIGSIGYKNILGLGYAETGVTSVNGETNLDIIPSEFVLKQNYPNPFNPETKIEFSLPVGSMVQLTIYNLLGEEIAKLIDGEMSAGTHSINWNASNADGFKLTSGIYFYGLKASGSNGNSFQEIKKMILLK